MLRDERRWRWSTVEEVRLQSAASAWKLSRHARLSHSSALGDVSSNVS